MRIEIYSKEHQKIWDDFVSHSKNGTFLFYRDFMEYHAHRINDHSFLFYKDNDLIALLPGNLSDNIYYSHQGLSYGGLIMSKATTTKDVLAIFDHLTTSLRQQGIKQFVYKAIPHIYHEAPAEEDLYALYINKAQLVGRGISSSLLLTSDKKYSNARKRGVKKGIANDLYIKETEDFDPFWILLEENLRTRYSTKPVHSAEEIKLLSKKFQSNILHYGVYDKEHKLIAGTVLFVTSKVIHLQYIASSEEGKKVGATDLLIDHLLRQNWIGKAYFDFGISTENNGLYLNEGLIHHKEGFGSRGITYDIYSIILN